jgi:hypothetical protein
VLPGPQAPLANTQAIVFAALFWLAVSQPSLALLLPAGYVCTAGASHRGLDWNQAVYFAVGKSALSAIKKWYGSLQQAIPYARFLSTCLNLAS